MSSRRAWFLAFAIVCFAIVAGNWALLSGRAAPQWDAADFFGPHFSLVADHIKVGHLLLWNPWVSGGNPDFAEPEFGATSPLVLLIAYLSPNPQAGFVAYWICLWLLGGLGMILLARHLGSPAWGSAVIALGFISSGLYTGQAEHTSTIFSVSFLPWILWRLDSALQNRKIWFAVQAGVLYGLSALGGYPEFTILTPLFLALWILCHILAKRGSGIIFAVSILAVTIAVGSVICSPSYVGFLKATHGYSDRVGPRTRQESIGSNILPAGALSTLASPYLPLLDLPPAPIWPVSDVSMSSVYMGACVLAFALLSLRQASRLRWWLAILGLFFICCALGNQLPLRGWLYDLLPPTRYFRNAALFRAYAMVLAACFAARGVRNLISLANQQAQRLALVIVCVLLACGALATFAFVVHSSGKSFNELLWSHISFHTAGVLQLCVVWIGMAALALLFQLNFLSGRAFSTLIVALALFDSLATMRISAPIMYSQSTLSWWHAMRAEHEPSMDLGEAGLNRQLDPPSIVGGPPNNRNIPLRVPVFENFVTFANRFQIQILADPVMRAMALGPNRMWFSPHPAHAPASDASFEVFRQSMHSSSAPLLVLHSTDQMLSITSHDVAVSSQSAAANSTFSAALSSPAEVSNVSYRPNYLTLTYQATEAGWLMVTDRWAPDWRVTVNGAPETVFGADFIYRAVHVNAGQNRISFRYRPPWFIPLVVVSWLVLLVYLMAESGRLLRSRRQP